MSYYFFNFFLNKYKLYVKNFDLKILYVKNRG